MERRYDVTALGEILVDLSQCGKSERGNVLLEESAGGAPANLLSMASQMGSRCAFIGKVGDDYLGHQLQRDLEAQGISCEGLVYDRRYATTLAFVHFDEEGKRHDSFHRSPGADQMLEAGEVAGQVIRASAVFAFGTVSFSAPESARATREAVRMAREAGCLIACDVNIRHQMWDDERELPDAIRFCLENSQILKVSDGELEEIMKLPWEEAAPALMARHDGLELLLVTRGDRGSCILGRGFRFHADAVHVGEAVDTTGAGDSFFGTILHFVAQDPESRWEEAVMKRAAQTAAAASGYLVTRVGSMRQMPSAAKVREILEQSLREERSAERTASASE